MHFEFKWKPHFLQINKCYWQDAYIYILKAGYNKTDKAWMIWEPLVAVCSCSMKSDWINWVQQWLGLRKWMLTEEMKSNLLQDDCCIMKFTYFLLGILIIAICKISTSAALFTSIYCLHICRSVNICCLHVCCSVYIPTSTTCQMNCLERSDDHG